MGESGHMMVNLEDILPHRSPMILIDSLVRCDADSATTVKTFAAGAYGTGEGGRVLESAIIESLAQTVAAIAGVAARRSSRRPGRGMLVGVSDFAFLGPVLCDLPIELTVQVTRRLGRFCLAAATARQDGIVLAQGDLKFYIEEEALETAE